MTGATGIRAIQLSMLNIEACKKILQKDGATYTDEQVKQLRQLLYKLGNLDYQLFSDLKKLKDGNSNHLHKSVHRRAS
jgi:hypothetical protein